MGRGDKAPRVLIAGGGIGGVAAALALARAGWEVSVHERAPAFGEVGAGLQISPNAARVLDWLGVLDGLVAVGFKPALAELRDGEDGELIYRAELGEAAERRWGAPYLHVHRADLLAQLLEAAEAAGARLVTGDPVEGYGTRADGVRVRMADGRSEAADMLLGADGLRSSMRTVLNGPEEPEFSGQVVWRGLVPAEALPAGLVEPNATVWAGPGKHVVFYYVRGGTMLNVVAVEEREAWAEESWSVPGDADDLRAAFAGWHPVVETVLSTLDRPFVWGLFQRPEQVRWSDGRVALIGDAAHAMLPFMAQGAAMALEDVAVLVDELARNDRIETALRAFEDRRWPRVAKVQAQSRSNGTLFHTRSILGRLALRTPMAMVSRMAPGLAAAQLDWLYGHDVTRGIE